MIEKYIIDTENTIFVNSIIDHERFINNKEIYDIYNNKIDEPLHKFWFVFDTTKFLNCYYEYNILTFVINDKNNKIKKTIDYIQKIAETIKQKYISHLLETETSYDNIDIEIPIKQYDNYPSIIKLYNKKKSIHNENNQKEEITNLCSGNKYLILFEINYFKIIKSDKNFTIKFFFNILKIQTQKLFNIDDYSLNKNIITIPLPPLPPTSTSFSSINYKINNDKTNDKTNDKINDKTNDKTNDKIRIIISEKELLCKRNELRSIKQEINKIDKKSDEDNSIDNFTKDLITQKNLLKQVKKKKTKKPKKSNIELERKLELELERKLELELEKELEHII
jgi:hypothetical protein